MRSQKNSWVGLLSLAMIVGMMANAALAQSAAPKSNSVKANPSSATAASAQESLLAPTCICPIYPVFDHGSYCTYYAIRCCDNQPVSLDAPCGLQTSDCATCLPDCQTGSCRVIPRRAKTLETHYVMPGLANKGVKKLSEVVIHSQAKAEQLGASFVVRFFRPDTGDQVFAKLSMVRVNQDCIIATGHEVENTPNAPLIKAESVSNNVGDCCFLLKVGSVEYQIITYEKPQTSAGKSGLAAIQQ